MKMYRFFIAALLLMSASVVSAKSIPECGYDPHVDTLDQMVERASGVYLVQIMTFTPSDQSNFGSYRVNVISTLLGPQQWVFDIEGYKPSAMVSQYYFDVTERHAQVDPDNLDASIGRGFIMEKVGDECQPFPDFIEGYTYLVFMGVNHELAFEPINSLPMDKWLQLARGRSALLSETE